MRSSIGILIALGLLLALAASALAGGSRFAGDLGSAYGSTGLTISFPKNTTSGDDGSPGMPDDVVELSTFSTAAAQYAFGDLVEGYAWDSAAPASNVALARFDSPSTGATGAYVGTSGANTSAPALASGFGGSVVGSITTGFEVRGNGPQSVESYSEHTSASGVVIKFGKVMEYNSGP